LSGEGAQGKIERKLVSITGERRSFSLFFNRIPRMSVEETDTPKTPKPTPTSRNGLAYLVILASNALLPTLVAGGLCLYLFSRYHLWQSNSTLMQIAFGVAVTVIALVLSFVYDILLAPIRANFRKQGVGLSKSITVRRATLALGGVVVPVLVLLGASFYVLAEGRTPINYLISASTNSAAGAPPEQIGSLALNSHNPSVKTLSIQALQAIHTPDALAQLMRLAGEDPQGMQDAGTRSALASAIASYGPDAKAPLLALFKSIPSAQTEPAAPGGGDLYNLYFSQSFDALGKEIDGNTLSAAQKEDQMSRLASAQAQLKTALAGLEENPPAAPGDARLDFVIQTFLQMGLSQDADLLAFANASAGDARYPSQVRGDALLLIARLGTQKDLDALYPFLKSSDAFIQARALQAITLLQQNADREIEK
jgi:chromate transport protein ChrA